MASNISILRSFFYGLIQLFLDNLEEAAKGADGIDVGMDSIRGDFHEVMKSEGVDHNSLAMEKGEAMEYSVGAMATELGGDEPDLYFSIYKRTSDIIHGNWRILEKFHLEKSIKLFQDET